MNKKTLEKIMYNVFDIVMITIAMCLLYMIILEAFNSDYLFI